MELSVVLQGFLKEGGGFDKKSFVARNLVSNVLTVPARMLKLYNDPVVTITIKNTDSLNETTSKKDFDTLRQVSVTVTCDVTALPEGTPIEMTNLKQGLFRYFTYTKKQSVKGIITLNVLSGEADLYIRKGADQFPDLVHYDFRSNTFKDDEIMLEATKPAAGAKDKTEVYIVGVYCSGDNSVGNSFEIKATTNTDFTLYKVVPGRLIRKYIHPGEQVILSYYNPHEEDFEIAVAGEKGPIDVRFSQFDETETPDFMSRIGSLSQGYKVTTVGYLHRQNIAPVKGTFKRQYLISVKPVSAGDQVVILVGPPQQQIMLEVNNDLLDTVTNKGCRKYEVNSWEETYGQQIEVELMVGNVKVTINQDADVSKENDSRQVFSLQTGLGSAVKKTVVKGAFGFLFGFYMEVCSFTPSSKVRIHVPQAHVGYTRLVPGQRVKHVLNKAGLKKKYYYRVNTTEVTSISLVFELDKLGGTYFKDFKDRVTKLHEIEKRLAFSFVSDKGFGFQQGEGETAPKLIAANIIRSKEYSNDIYRYARLDFQVQTGEFLISSAASGNSETNDYVQFQLIVNDYQLISPSGLTTVEFQTGKYYSMLVHKDDPNSQSKLRLRLTCCTGSAQVEFRDPDNNNALIDSRVLNDELDRQYAEISSNSSSTVIEFTQNTILIVATGGPLKQMLEPYDTTILNINSEIISGVSRIGIQEYFHSGSEKKQWNLEVVKGERDFSISLDGVQPSEGFHERYPKFEFATVQYTVFVNPNAGRSSLNSYNSCKIDREQNKNKVIREVSRNIKKVEQGQLVFPAGRVLIDQIMYPLDTQAPYVGWVQISINLEGNFSDGQDDDSMVLIKLPFVIEDDPILQQPRVRLGLIVIVLCIIVILVTVIARRMLKTLGNIQQIVERKENRAGFEMAGLKLEGDNSPNKIETADEAQELANTSNDTHTI